MYCLHIYLSISTYIHVIWHFITAAPFLQVARVFYYLCVVTLHYLVPVLLILNVAFLLKTLGKYKILYASHDSKLPINYCKLKKISGGL